MHIVMLGAKGIPLPAGIDNVIEQVGVRLVQRGHRVTVYVRSHYTPRGQVNYRGLRLLHVPSIRTRSLDAITATFFATLLSIREKPDIAHIHSQGLSVYAPLPRMFGIKTIVQSHGLDWQRAKWGAFARSYLRMTDYTTTAFPDATVVVSRKLQRYYQAHSKRSIFFIPNGVSPIESNSVSAIRDFGLVGGDYILFAARLVPEKWCHGLLDAYQRIYHPNKKLVIAGDSFYGDPYATALKAKASENILFPGFVTGRAMKELMEHAYFYVLPSEIEGLSTGLLEAMSYGKCVLVSDIEENLEVVGDCGVTFRTKDAADLTHKLNYLLENPKIVKELGEKARIQVSALYDWEEITSQYETLYQDLL